MKKTGLFFFLFFISFSLLSEIFPQIPSEIVGYRMEPSSNMRYEKESVLDGNNIRTLFKNTGEIGHWPFQPSLEWPKGTGHSYLDGLTLLVGAEVTAPRNQAIIHPIEAAYREEMDANPVTGEIWGIEPIPGYSNPSSTKPAISTDPSSWPDHWPIAFGLGYPDLDGKFPSYFGWNSKRAAFESFFVTDDSRDNEFNRAPYNYYPILSDTSRGGLGLRIENRLLQFKEFELQNVLFMQYDITNISDFSYDKTCFGYYLDPGVGGPYDNSDNFRYDTKLDITYAYDSDGKGTPGSWATGYMGFVLLETPSNSTNGIDDDEDGMIDERQDDGIDNDGDWNALTDDIGMDGLANTNDYGEGDGIPTDGEPNFDKTDKDEADQIGLNAVSFVSLAHTFANPWPKNDEAVWQVMVGGFADTSISNSNVNAVFSSGPFPFQKFSRAKISSAIICENTKEELFNTTKIARQIYNHNYSGLRSTSGNISLTLTKPTNKEKVLGVVPVQYSLANYTGSASHYIYHYTPSEGWTLLGIDESNSGYFYWQTNTTQDGIVHKIRIISFTDKGVLEVTSDFFTVQNNPTTKPDIIILSPSNEDKLLGNVTVKYYAGDAEGNSGLVNFYYKAAPYSIPLAIASSLTEKDSLFTWETENYANSTNGELIGQIISGYDTTNYSIQNLVIKNERILPVGSFYTRDQKTIGTGFFDLNVINRSQISGDDYLVVFDSSYFDKPVLYYKLYDKTKGNTFISDVFEIEQGIESPLFDGFRISVTNDTASKAIKESMTRWWVFMYNANTSFSVSPDMTSAGWNGRADYELRFSDVIVDTTFVNSGVFKIFPIKFQVFNITSNYKTKVAIADYDLSNSFTSGDEIRILEFNGSQTLANAKTSWRALYQEPLTDPVPPVEGDIFRIVAQKEFVKGDSITFTTSGLVGVKDVNVKPSSYSLSQNYPNPFNPVTKIQFTVPQNEIVKIKVYDFLGAEIATLVNKEMNSGSYEVDFNGKTLASGIYFVRMEAGKFIETKKIVLLK